MGKKAQSFIITGSRLPQQNGIGLAPLVVVDQEEFRLTGTVNAESLLNDLPQLTPGLTAFVNNGGDGSAHLNLRALGTADTLVLVDGRRWIPDNTGEAVDIDTIPVSLIDSVEVQTGGASAAYGSGAVAGTVNFRLRQFEGLTAGATSAFTGHNDGRRSELHIGYGSEFASGRGHVNVFGEYLTRRPILADARPFSRFQLVDSFDGNLAPTGSTAVPGGYFESLTDFFFGLGTNYGNPAATFSAPGISRPFSFGTAANSLGDLYNFAPDNYLMVPQRRWFGNARADYEISSAARIYGELTYVNNKTREQLAPTPVFDFPTIDLNAIASYLSASDLAQLQLISEFDPLVFGTPPGTVTLDVRYRTVQLGPRRFTQNRNAWHGLAGVTGDLGPLTYDVSYSYARTSAATRETGEVNLPAFDTLVSNGGCNVFGPGLLSDSCIGAISLPLASRESIRQEIAQATISGPLFRSPFSNDPAKFSLGAEWRSMRGEYSPDPNQFISTGSISTPANGHYSSKEVFGELSIPLVQRATLHVVELDGGARYSHYSLNGVRGEWIWYAGAKIEPSPDIALRGQYQRTLRAPHISELFLATTTSYPFFLDPCSFYASDFSDQMRQFCIASGVPAANVFNFDPGFQVPAAVGGNTRLRAETGNSWDAGVVLKPRFLPRLSASVDYFDIRQHNTIEAIDGGALVNACYSIIRDLSSPICQAVVRDSSTGEIVSIDSTVKNIGSRKTSGVDAVIDYAVPVRASVTGAGHSSLAWHLIGTWLNKSRFGDPAFGTIKCEGRFGTACGNPQPRLTWQSRLSWIDGPLTTTIRWRHTGPVRDDDPSTDYVVEHIAAYNLFDLAFEARVNDRFTINLGVNNLFNKHPPILGSNADFSGSNTYPGTYDILGRDFFVSAEVSF